ncbi:unnamed protein product [Rotaria magnacalcarata]|uniref:Fibrinogen C-terminal domain-containing protein n=3 Tax=Rotaria magnacalcarata TaxID=392030 RepID=A0A818Z8F2_9BILA|nr:unnamed protein product [Rotaria magnacalcarata]CAF3764921.1 unnamed protein product [Rotaria magnacalcarata]CAF3884550.1 unnamed protein product [Rotaria magnacalcarata]
MLKEQQQQFKRLNSSLLNPNNDIQIVANRPDMLSTPTTTPTRTKTNHRKIRLFNIERLTRLPSNVTIERCCFLLIHLLFYIIILTIVYIRLDQFTNKQEKIFRALNSNNNSTQHDTFQHHSLNCNRVSPPENNAVCSCEILSYPRRNRTTNCLQINIGLTDTLENIFCQTDEQPQWLVIQNRQTSFVDFNRTWIEYRRGFGNALNQTDFWIGNENLHWLTNSYSCRLKIELTDWYNETRRAIYEIFHIANQKDGYRIQISGYHGDMEGTKKLDSFSRWHYNARFSTHDHYATSTNCPKSHGGGGWWYHSGIECAHTQLNGRFATHSDGLIPFNTGILWIGWKADRHYSFQRATMSIQSKSKHNRVPN